MAIPAKPPFDMESVHVRISSNNVLDGSSKKMAIMRESRRKRRPVVESKLFPALGKLHGSSESNGILMAARRLITTGIQTHLKASMSFQNWQILSSSDGKWIPPDPSLAFKLASEVAAMIAFDIGVLGRVGALGYGRLLRQRQKEAYE